MRILLSLIVYCITQYQTTYLFNDQIKVIILVRIIKLELDIDRMALFTKKLN